MHILRIILLKKPKNPPIFLDSNGQPLAMCYLCHYWTERTDLICAVNIPEPTEEELAKASGRPAFAIHNCRDFKRKLEPKPESTDGA